MFLIGLIGWLSSSCSYSANTPAQDVMSPAQSSSIAASQTITGPAITLSLAPGYGQLEGVQTNGVEHFLGIPFAEPPVQAWRWRPPRPSHGWFGVRKANTYAANCLAAAPPPQSAPAGTQQAPLTARAEANEDCLYLDVQRPAHLLPQEKLPVVVWLRDPLSNPLSHSEEALQTLVKTHHIIGVTINYRVGVFGFLSFPALTREAGESGNYGFMDQQAALWWIKQHIAAFGGDPNQITLAAQPSDAPLVCGHLAATGSKGLFKNTLIDHTVCQAIDLKTAEQIGQKLVEKLNCDQTPDPASCMRAIDATTLLLNAQPLTAQLVYDTPTFPEAPHPH